jgi:hypothetical protein
MLLFGFANLMERDVITTNFKVSETSCFYSREQRKMEKVKNSSNSTINFVCVFNISCQHFFSSQSLSTGLKMAVFDFVMLLVSVSYANCLLNAFESHSVFR